MHIHARTHTHTQTHTHTHLCMEFQVSVPLQEYNLWGRMNVIVKLANAMNVISAVG